MAPHPLRPPIPEHLRSMLIRRPIRIQRRGPDATPGGHGDDHATGRQIQVDGASMASSVSLRKMSTVWSMRRAGAHPTALGRRGGRVVTTTVEEPPGETTAADGARRGRGRPLASLGAAGTWGRIGCGRIASRLSSFPTSPVRRRAEGYRRPLRRSASRCGLPLRTQPGLPKEKGRLGNNSG